MKKQIGSLSHWEWGTLVASWRYYEYRMTIASASFPEDIINRFWTSGKYSKKVLDMIAHQFADVDHGLGGEEDWTSGLNSKYLQECDKRPWCMFFAFCWGWSHGFETIKTVDGGTSECFFCCFTGKWHPVEDYIRAPQRQSWVQNAELKGKDAR